MTNVLAYSTGASFKLKYVLSNLYLKDSLDGIHQSRVNFIKLFSSSLRLLLMQKASAFVQAIVIALDKVKSISLEPYPLILNKPKTAHGHTHLLVLPLGFRVCIHNNSFSS